MMGKKIPTLTEFIDEYPDVHNVREGIHDFPGASGKIKEIFARHGVDLSKERESYEVYAWQLVCEAKSSGEQRLDTSQKQRQITITFYELLIDKLKLLAEDPYFCRYLRLKPDVINSLLVKTETVLATFLEHNKRAGRIKSIKYWLRYLLPYLHNSRLSETKRVNLIYDLLVEFDATEIIFQDTDDPIPKKRILEAKALLGGMTTLDTGEIDEIEAKGRIRDWDREIMKAYKNNPSQ